MSMQTDVKAATVTEEGSAYAARARVKALTFVTTATAGSVQIEDGNGGAVKLNIATPAVADLHHVLLPGEGVIPLDDILIRLKHIGFDGLCSIELFRPEYWERAPEELARAARAATLEVLETYFKVE